MPLYTFIADHQGGTYVSQVTAPNEVLAVSAWAKNLDIEAIPNLEIKTNEELLEVARRDEEDGVSCTLLEGLSNVWCFCVCMERTTMFVNFVQTDQET